jgi:hypothetical protein
VVGLYACVMGDGVGSLFRHRLREHRVFFCAPYWSCDGAVEYAFNIIQTKLQMDLYRVDSVFVLVNKMHTIVGKMQSFTRYFIP